MKKPITLFILELVLLIGFSLAPAGGRVTGAQTAGSQTAQQALETVLAEYVTFTSQTEVWQLGEIKQADSYAISIARSESAGSSERGHVLLLARRQSDGLWYAVAPELVEATFYNAWLEEMPSTLLDEFDKSFFYRYTPADFSYLEPRSVSLHHFPWPIGQTARVTQKEGEYHTNQIDFFIRESNNVYASKPGIVIYAKEVSSIGGCDYDLWRYANVVVVQHTLTEYSWYFHFAKDSVTVEVGDLIGYGTKIGEQGNTGLACGTTGIHLHYMVSTDIPAVFPDPNIASNAPWPPGGTIVTVDFIEGSWNSLVVGQIYQSQNAPSNSSCNDNPLIPAAYENTYCSGKIAEWNQEGLHTLESAGLADNIESIEVPAGWSAALYRDENEIGPSLCLNQTDFMLWDNAFSDGTVAANRTSWLRLYQTPDCPYPDEQGIKFFSGTNFSGTPVWGMVGPRSTNGPSHLGGSIYLPGGYAATIFDQDNMAGNSLCFTESILNLGDLGWADRKIESIQFELGGACAPVSDDIPQPVLVSPAPDATVYGLIAPELCWSAEGDTQGILFKAQVIKGATVFESGWILDTCWTPEAIAGAYDTYSWRVRAKNVEDTLGEWSLPNSFAYEEDTVLPFAGIVSPLENGRVVRPRTNIVVDASDNESGIARVYFFGWYDDGSGAGYDWHYLGEDNQGGNGWQFTWNLQASISNDAAVWVYAEDFGGNYGSDYHPGIEIVNTMANEEGFEYREGESRESVEESAHSAPEIPAGPAIPIEEDNTGGGPAEEQAGKPENLEGPEDQENEDKLSPQEIKPLSAVSGMIQPKPGEVFYGPQVPQLCWEPVQAAEPVEYRVEIQGGEQIMSSWMADTCWTPGSLEEAYGIYDWRVRARTASGEKSAWSERSAFSFVVDDRLPLVMVDSPRNGGGYQNDLTFDVQATDDESGVQRVYFLAWYEDEIGSGYQWHTLSEVQANESGEYRFSWDISELEPQDIQVWVYVEDGSQNFGYARVENLRILDASGISVATSIKALKDTVGRQQTGE